MKQKYRFMRTRSQCRQESPFGSEAQAYSYSTHMKFKPFSEECTMNHIEETLTSFRNTITHQRCKTSLKDTHNPLPFQTRLKSIINHSKLTRKRRKIKHEEDDDESNDSEPVEQRLRMVSNRSKEHSRSRLSQLQKDIEVKQEKHVHMEVRHNLSEQSKEQEYAFYSSIHRPQPRASTLLSDFNKNNCFLFSRSKRKVLQVQQQPKQKEIRIKDHQSKFQSFGTYFYGSYMRKYMERRSLLGRRTELINKIAQ